MQGAEGHPITQASSGEPKAERPRKVLFSAMKNEAPFVLEWIAYHKVIGFDEIVICSNPSNDGMEEILAALAEAGEIRHLQAVNVLRRSAQHVASAAFSREVGYRDGNWYMWLDADEFLNVHVGDRTVTALIDALGDRRCALVNWRVFGSSGKQTFGGRFVHSDFSRASLPEFAENVQIKSIFRMTAGVRGFAHFGIHRPVIAVSGAFSTEDVVVGNGRPASPGDIRHERWLEGKDFPGSARVSASETGWALAQINHYVVRTPEFFALKKLRGRGFKANAAGDANGRHSRKFFLANDRNEAEDRSILHWQDRVTEEIARLMSYPAVAAAKVESDRLVAEVLASLPTDALPATVARAASSPAPALEAEPAETEVPMVLDIAEAFDRAERVALEAAFGAATRILEYGSGASTALAARLGRPIISVESDREWAGLVREYLAGVSDLAQVHHVNVGPTGERGMPTRPRFHRLFHAYPLSVWDRPDLGEPDLVFIDGRFRLACLLAVRLRARQPTAVLIDDYAARPHYHAAEKIARKDGMAGRMARFTVTPGPIPPEMLTEAIGWFADPR